MSSVALPIFAATNVSCDLSLSFTSSNQEIPVGGNNVYAVVLENTGQKMCKDATFSVYYGKNESVVAGVPAARAGGYYWITHVFQPRATMDVLITTAHTPNVAGEEIRTEVCATADNAPGDICKEIVTGVSGAVSVEVESDQVIVPSATSTQPVASTTPPVSSTTTPVVSAPQASSSPVTAPVPSGKELGMWVWESPLQMSSEYVQRMLTTLKDNGMNVAYITIDDYLPIAAMTEGTQKKVQKDAYFLKLNQIITDANALGIAVDVEGGWRDWAIPENRWKGYALITFVAEYNAAYPQAKVRGLQYDVEPYLLPTYESNKESVLTPFVAFIDESVQRMQNVDAQFTVVIPHFYDSAQKWTPTITYNGKTQHTFSHLLDILEQKKGSSIILMSYRNFFEGTDGTGYISEAEIKEATAGGYATSVIVAQETGNVDPGYVTFYGMTKQQLFTAVNTINTSFKSYTRFGGVAIHYLDSFLDLR